MTETAHTPLPWAVSSGCDQYICNGDSWIASTMGIRGEEGAANTALIVQAVNSHHRLVEALRGLVQAIERRYPYGDPRQSQSFGDALKAADAILTKEAGHG